MPSVTARFKIEPLSSFHDRAAFSCGVQSLDHYLQTQARQDLRKRVATCFVLTECDAKQVLGFYTLSATTVALTDLPTNLARKLPRYPLVPATLMGRLAVDMQRRGDRLGELLLLDAFARTLRSEIGTFAFIVDAIDDSAQAFYERYNFRVLPSVGRRLYLPMAEVAMLFESAM